MKKIFILGQIIFLLTTSCSRHSFKAYVVQDNLKFKRKSVNKADKIIHPSDLSCITIYYQVPKNICEDTLKLKTVANKIFKKNHRRYLHSAMEKYKLIMTSDTAGYFAYRVRVIHGRDEMTFDKKKCIIVLHKSYTGQF